MRHAQLVVGSDDFDLRVFKDDAIIDETSESDAIVALQPVGGKRFAYALANGTLGVYENLERIWRIKVSVARRAARLTARTPTRSRRTP